MITLPRSLLAAAALATAMTLAAAASAQDPATQSGPANRAAKRFATMDQNGDGTVTAEEVRLHHAARFQAIDSDGDGQLTLAEFEAMRERRRQERMKQRLSRMDTNGDGTITQEEFAAKGSRWMTRLDGDGDGQVTLDEVQKSAAQRPWGQGQGGRPGCPMAMGGPQAGQPGM